MTDAVLDHCSTGKVSQPEANEPLGDTQFQAIEDELVRLAVHINAATYRMLCLIRELDAHGAALCMGFASTAHYLNWRIGLDLGTAREKVRVAKALAVLPLTSEALEHGKISYAKARAITRIATPETEESLLNIALHGTASHLDKVVCKYRRGAEVTYELSETQHEGRYLHMHHDDQGMLVIEARLPPEEGAVFVKALEAAQEVAWKRDENVPAGTSVAPSQKRADAVGILARAALGHGLGGETVGKDAEGTEHGAPGIDASRFEVVVHVDSEALQNPEAGGRCDLEAGGNVPAGTLRRIACDSGLVVMAHDGQGNVLDVGRKTRTIPAPMRRALAARDHGCRFPGCDRSRFVDAHHIHHWADGGETKLDNLVELCRFHHRCLHEGGYSVRRLQDATLEFIAPSGRLLPASGALVPADDEAFSRDWREIQEKAATGADLTVWNGEKLDYGWVIESLLSHQGRA